MPDILDVVLLFTQDCKVSIVCHIVFNSVIEDAGPRAEVHLDDVVDVQAADIFPGTRIVANNSGNRLSRFDVVEHFVHVGGVVEELLAVRSVEGAAVV